MTELLSRFSTRFSTRASDVEIRREASIWICSDCALIPCDESRDVRMDSARQMIVHLHRHLDAGQLVPHGLLDRLAARRD